MANLLQLSTIYWYDVFTRLQNATKTHNLQMTLKHLCKTSRAITWFIKAGSVWIIGHCLWLGYEIMVCVVCFTRLLYLLVTCQIGSSATYNKISTVTKGIIIITIYVYMICVRFESLCCCRWQICFVIVLIRRHWNKILTTIFEFQNYALYDFLCTMLWSCKIIITWWWRRLQWKCSENKRPSSNYPQQIKLENHITYVTE